MTTSQSQAIPPKGDAIMQRQYGLRLVTKWLYNNRRAVTSATFLAILLLVFLMLDPTVFTQFRTYRSVMIALPISIFVVIPLVFVVTAGEIDLSFPAVVGFSSYAFALVLDSGGNPLLAILAALATGALLGLINGVLIVYVNLSSLVATLGMNFLLRGAINIRVKGFSIAIPEIRGSTLHKVLTEDLVLGIPNQMLWAIAFTIFGWFLYNRHVFGARVHCTGDHPGSSREMGISVNRTRVQVFVFTGIGAALAGIFSIMINYVWYPTTGDGLLLPVLAGIFMGGTPTWGGVGTVVGGAIGATTVAFIGTGVIAVGLTGFYTQFFNGLIIILSLIGQRLNGARLR
jgi:simple sugar transport system permease protein